MKILFVAHSGEISGGANRSLLSLICQLRDRRGVEPCVLVPAKDSAMEKACAGLSIPVYTGAYHTCCTVYRREPKDAVRFLKLIAAPAVDRYHAQRISRSLPEDFDLIYTNERMIIIGGYLARMRRIPHVWHVRSFSTENKTHFSPFWYALMNRFSDRIVLISQALADRFRRYIPDGKLRLVYNGLEAERYMAESKPREGRLKLLLTGRIVPAKGQREALQALELLVHRHGVDAELYFAGQIPTYEDRKYWEALTEFVRAHGLENRVHFLGEVSDMLEVRRKMDVELVCSWFEAFGRVTVEAMLAERPVVGANTGGTAEIVEDGRTGLLYDVSSAEDLAEKVLWMHGHPEEAAAMARRGKQRAVDCFSMENTADRVWEVICEAVEEMKKQ